MAHIAGDKIGGSHTTLNSLAKDLVQYLQTVDIVTKIVLGVVSNRAGKGGQAPHSVKIIDESSCILVRATKKASISEFRFYTIDVQSRADAKLMLARFVRDNGWNLRFRKF